MAQRKWACSGKSDGGARRRYPGEQTRVTSESRRSQMSGAPSYSSQPYPYKNIHGYLRQIFEAFGPERLFWGTDIRSEEHTSELQSLTNLVCRLLLEKKKKQTKNLL